MKTRRLGVGTLATLLLGGCVNLAPEYERPVATTPTIWPGVGETGAPPPVVAGDVSDLGWRDFFLDARLQRTVGLALEHNADLATAALNIAAARAQVVDTGALLFPDINAAASATFSRAGRTDGAGDALSDDVSGNQDSVSESLALDVAFASYEIDFFGRLRNQRQAALAALLSSQADRRATQISLIGEVASLWLELSANKALLALAEQALTNRRENLALVRARNEYGVASGSDVANARSLVESARADVATLTTTIAQDRNALNRVVGITVPASALPGARVPDEPVIPSLPAGIPSRVLTNRPDVIAAEYTLRGDYATIGAARAAFFPRVSLTAATGWATSGLTGLFAEDNRVWSVTPSIDVPIFDGGSRAAQLALARIQRAIDVVDYQRTLRTAFREVADALAVRATIDERLDALQALVAANQRSYRLSLARYEAGADSYLDVLIEQRALYTSRQDAIQGLLARQANLVTLYKVLGGGGLADSAEDAPVVAPVAPDTSPIR